MFHHFGTAGRGQVTAYGRQQALDVVRILDALEIQRAHIIGFSLGSSTVAQLLKLHPERFLSEVQVGGAGRTPEEANDPRIEIEAAEKRSMKALRN